ncbi:Amphiphysin-like protein [Metarhizium guizhouense ARSEF 977]|uniref:Amphiphysin-like protein n=1 Tax=Metarhizium guizhouense (strain ARSEF 977) TaxID=1276136 RepID=A0A0B4HG82_METGA|nr:Amphiphysin-like protein [Metarhizium guizhouense ARSEF 977]
MTVDTWAADLATPFEVDRLLEVRISGMKKMPGLNIDTGIDKKTCHTPVRINKLGLEGDWHDSTFHGGPDKAILGYCSSHYSNWKALYPERADRFVPGGFGENLVTSHMNERNVCIGDVIAFGPEVQLQVSLPRQPCFKLNHRFSLKNFAPVTYQTSRTGWYYRVVREGAVQAGDEIRLVERKWPQWTIERIQEYLHRDKDNLAMNRQIAEIDVLGEECRGQFRNRVAKALRKKTPKKEDSWADYKVIQRKTETSRVVSLALQCINPDPEAELPLLGAHARLKLPNGLVRTYSVVSSGDSIMQMKDTFELGIALEENSRGGSRHLHESAKVGDTIQVSRITSDIPPASSASNHVFIAGGIGITAFLALMRAMLSINWSCELHYAVRSADDVPFAERLATFKENVVLYNKSQGQRMDIHNIIKAMPWNSHVYACGPTRMMEAVKSAVDDCGIAPDEVHYEAFAADVSGDPFEAEIANRGGKILKVGESESLLEVLRREYPDIASSCEVGNCGTCKISVRRGRIDHRGAALLLEEKDSAMLACVSRGIGRVVIEV